MTRLARNVPLCFVYAFLMDFSLSAPIWVLYLRDERGLSMAEITFLEVPLFLLIVLAEVPTGAVADRYGRRVSLRLAGAVLAVSMYVYGVADDYALILVSNLAWGLGFAFRSGADTALLYDSLRALGRVDEFQRIIGRLSALRSAAMLGGLLLGAPLAAATSYSFAIVSAAGIAAAAMLVALLMREVPPQAAAAPCRETSARSYLGTLGAGIREVLDKPALRALFVFSAVVGVCAAGPVQLLQQPWLSAHQVETSKLGLLQAAANGAAAAAALAAAGLLRRLGARSAFAILPLGLFLCCGLLGISDQLFAGVAFLGIASVAGLQIPLLSDEINRQIESGTRATTLSVNQMFSNVGMAVVWPLAGASVDAVGLQPVFLGYALGALVLGIWSLRVWARTDAALRRA